MSNRATPKRNPYVPSIYRTFTEEQQIEFFFCCNGEKQNKLERKFAKIIKRRRNEKLYRKFIKIKKLIPPFIETTEQQIGDEQPSCSTEHQTNTNTKSKMKSALIVTKCHNPKSDGTIIILPQQSEQLSEQYNETEIICIDIMNRLLDGVEIIATVKTETVSTTTTTTSETATATTDFVSSDVDDDFI